MLSKEIEKDILFVKQILTKWQLSGYVSEEIIDKIDGILHYSEQLESDKQKLIKKLEKILEKYEHEIASEESAINLYTEIKEIAKGEKE